MLLLGQRAVRLSAECPDLRFYDLRREAIIRFIERRLTVIEGVSKVYAPHPYLIVPLFDFAGEGYCRDRQGASPFAT